MRNPVGAAKEKRGSEFVHNSARELGREAVFFIFFARNPLKRLDSEKKMKGNERTFSFIVFRELAFACKKFAQRLYPRRGPYCARNPPSTASVCPVTIAAAGLTRKAIAAAISAGSASFRKGVIASMRATSSGSLRMGPIRSVRT